LAASAALILLALGGDDAHARKILSVFLSHSLEGFEAGAGKSVLKIFISFPLRNPCKYHGKSCIFLAYSSSSSLILRSASRYQKFAKKAEFLRRVPTSPSSVSTKCVAGEEPLRLLPFHFFFCCSSGCLVLIFFCGAVKATRAL